MTTCPRCGKETDQPFHTCLKMKTPQQEAEKLIEKAALAWSLSEGPSASINDFIRQEIPLAQYIAVARAANRVVTEKSIRNQMQAEFEMLKAIDDLRATRKVEL